MLIIKRLFCFTLWLSPLQTLAQPPVSNPSMKNYFRSPVGIPMKLSANFGELRPDHWHMGLDIRTNAQENLPIYAAAEGYIAHVGIRSSGYGRFIIINHPNGTSTLYAHLNDFHSRLEEFVTNEQYKRESWAVEIDFTKDQFPVTKGSFIAFSGNTGGSQGPHLHFEIMETASQRRLNPLLFNFNIYDHTPPVMTRLAVYDRSKSIYAQAPVLYNLKNTDSGYVIPKIPLLKTGLSRLSFAIQAYDRLEKGSSEDGIYSSTLFLNEEPVVGFVLDSIGFDERVYMNAHIDYRYDQQGGPFLQLLTELPGNRSTVYKQYSGDGLIRLLDTSIHYVKIEITDAHGNSSLLQFQLQFDDSLQKQTGSPWPEKLSPNKINFYQKPDFSVGFNRDNLYDTVPADYFRARVAGNEKNALSDIHQLNQSPYPLHGEVVVSIKPDLPVDDVKDFILIQRTNKGNTVRKAELKNGWAMAKFGDFGRYQVLVDQTPPTINSPGKGDTINLSSANRIVFTPADNFGVIKSLRVELDGQWLRFTNDKGKNWIYKFDERCPYGVHELKATVTDLVGNTTTETWWFKRMPYTPPPPKKKKSTKSKKKK